MLFEELEFNFQKKCQLAAALFFNIVTNLEN